MAKLERFLVEAEQTDIETLLAEIEAEEDGLCPARVWCLTKRLKVSKHATPSFHCGFEEHHALWQCRESGNGHERILDRGIAEARCAGAAFCGQASCPHAVSHRWKADDGCDRIKCRKLETIPWDEEMRGERPDSVVICEQSG